MTYTYPSGRTPQEVYDDLYETTEYGRRGRGINVFHGIEVIDQTKGYESMLNVGCGLPDYAQHVPWIGSYVGCDISPHVVKYHNDEGRACIHEDVTAGLNLTSNQFDVVACFDVMEHIPEEDVDFALSELARVAKHMTLLTIAYAQTRRAGTQGEPLHICIHGPDWWIPRIEAATGGKVEMVANCFVVRL